MENIWTHNPGRDRKYSKPAVTISRLAKSGWQKFDYNIDFMAKVKGWTDYNDSQWEFSAKHYWELYVNQCCYCTYNKWKIFTQLVNSNVVFWLTDTMASMPSFVVGFFKVLSISKLNGRGSRDAFVVYENHCVLTSLLRDSNLFTFSLS